MDRFEQQLEAYVLESFNLTDAMATDLAGESADNITPILWTATIITSAVEC